MLSFSAPWVLALAGVAAALIAGLHLLSVRRPPVLLLPTARFVPDGEARSVARQPRPNDLLLLALRVTSLLCAGLALAGVQWHSAATPTVRLVVADAQFRDDSAQWLTPDSTERVDLIWQDHVSTDPGVALVAAMRAAAARAQREPGIQQFGLTVVLPPAATSLRGWEAWRPLWPGPVEVLFTDTLRQAREQWEAPSVFVQAKTGSDDVVAAAFADAPTAQRAESATTHAVLLDRGGADDGMVAPSGTTSVVVAWPQNGRPEGWPTRATPDTVGALVANGQALVGPWVRTVRPPENWRADSLAMPVAWWSDGEVAAIERSVDDGCVRTVAIAVPAGSDLLLSPPSAGLRRALTAPCGGPTLSTARVNVARATDPAAPFVPAAAFRLGERATAGSDPWWLAPALLFLATLALAAEWMLRLGETSA